MLDNDDSTHSTDSSSVPPTVPPKRVRVSALAKDLGIASKQLVALLAELGEGTKTASSTLDAGPGRAGPHRACGRRPGRGHGSG